MNRPGRSNVQSALLSITVASAARTQRAIGLSGSRPGRPIVASWASDSRPTWPVAPVIRIVPTGSESMRGE
jgi:hypothetical protein